MESQLKEYSEFIKEKERDMSQHTIRMYKYSIELFLKNMNILNVDQINSLTINEYRRYRDDLLDSGLSKSSVNSHIRNISSFVNWLFRYEYLSGYPGINKLTPLKLPKKVIFALDQDECKAMVVKTNNLGKKLMLVLMFQTVLRRGEIVEIKLTDIAGNKILVHGKGNKERLLTLTNEACSLLEKYLQKRKINSEYLFTATGGKLSTDAVGQRVKSAAKHAEIDPERLKKVTAHVTRKTFATNLVDNGIPINVIQSALGHSSVNTTMLYAKVHNKNIENAMLSQENLIES